MTHVPYRPDPDMYCKHESDNSQGSSSQTRRSNQSQLGGRAKKEAGLQDVGDRRALQPKSAGVPSAARRAPSPSSCYNPPCLSIMASSSSLSVDLPALQKHLHQTTSFAAALPAKSDLAFHRSVDPALAVRLDEASGRVWELVDSLLGWVDDLNDGGQKPVGAKKKRKREEDDLVENFEETVIAEGVDGLLERAVRRPLHLPTPLPFAYGSRVTSLL